MRAALVLTLVVLAPVVLTSVMLVGPPYDSSRQASEPQPLPRIAPAPEFALTSQDGAPVTLASFRGRVVALICIYTLCTDSCPILTPMMSFVQDRLGRDFGTKIASASITIDLERDTPEVLKEYAQAFGADLAG